MRKLLILLILASPFFAQAQKSWGFDNGSVTFETPEIFEKLDGCKNCLFRLLASKVDPNGSNGVENSSMIEVDKWEWDEELYLWDNIDDQDQLTELAASMVASNGDKEIDFKLLDARNLLVNGLKARSFTYKHNFNAKLYTTVKLFQVEDGADLYILRFKGLTPFGRDMSTDLASIWDGIIRSIKAKNGQVTYQLKEGTPLYVEGFNKAKN